VSSRLRLDDTLAGTTTGHDRGMNGFGTERTRPLAVGLMSAGWVDGNPGENLVVSALNASGCTPAFGRSTGVLQCHQQYAVGRYVLDFAWPKLKIALEADGSVHRREKNYRHDQRRDEWFREQGWLVFRVHTTRRDGVTAQVHRVLAVVRAMAQGG
jgi:hypothetical protein